MTESSIEKSREFEYEQEALPRIPPPNSLVTTRTIAMPADTNWHGDIFGGWLMSEVDKAGSIPAFERSGGRVVTIAVHRFLFIAPVSVGEIVSCYAEVINTGRTSIRVAVNVFAGRETLDKVAEAELSFVAIDAEGRPRPFN